MKTDPFSIRLPEEQHTELIAKAAATGGTYSKSEIISRALRVYFAILDQCPTLLPEYDPEQDRSVTHVAGDVTHSPYPGGVTEMITGR